MLSIRHQLIGALLIQLVAVSDAAANPDRDAADLRRRFADASVWVVGERHRVAANHHLFASLVAQTLGSGEQVLVGLEIPSDRQAALDKVLVGGAGGVASVVIDCPSYRELLSRLGELGQAHPGRLAVRAIDAPIRATQDRDQYMAEALGRLPVRGQRVVVLVGNLHALKSTPRRAEARHERLASRLAATGVRVASLLQLGPGRFPAGKELGVRAPTEASAGPAALAIARLVAVPDGDADRWLGRAADAVILRP